MKKKTASGYHLINLEDVFKVLLNAKKQEITLKNALTVHHEITTVREAGR